MTGDADPGPVLLVHGVGIGAAVFDGVAPLLANGGLTVAVPDRRGYGSSGLPPVGELRTHVDDLLALAPADRPAVLVGVSGGATLALLAAIEHPERWSHVIVHEPLAGPLVPEQHDLVTAAAARLAATPGTAGVEAFLAGLVGAGTWRHLPAPVRAAALAAEDTVRAEVPPFVAFAPTAETVATVRCAVTTGACSPGWRGRAAIELAAIAGCAPVVIPGCGHLAPLEAPAAFAGAVLAVIRR